MMAAIGLTDHQKLKRMHINRRVFMDTVKRYDQIYPEVPVGCFNSGVNVPENYQLLSDRLIKV